MISVDRWGKGSQAYFLTHLHADHTRGLSSSWRRGPLYCSRISAKLFPLKFPDFDLSSLRVLNIGCWHRLSLSSPSSGSPAEVDVMPIDALHCPGAVMFMFRGEFGHVLYTGDFRWETTGERSQKARAMLLDALNGANVDVLYLDNTYCNPAYCFPSREVAAQQVIEIIASHPEHDIIIGIDSLGKEDLLLQISHCLKTKIWVWPERLQIMHILGYPDVFTTRTSLTRVRAVPRYSFRTDTLEGLNTLRPTIGIMPSGLPWMVKPFEGKSKASETCLSVASTSRGYNVPNGIRVDRNMRTVERVHQYIYSVPYSDHSCFPEIKDFVQLIRPSNVKGIVSLSPWYVDPLYYLSHLFRSNQRPQINSPNPENQGQAKRVQGQGKMKSKDFRGTRQRAAEVNFFGVRIRRVTIMRRKHRGVKIVESPDPD